MLRDVFAEHGLDCCAKTSGSKGLQLYVPLNTKVTYEETKVVSKGLAQVFEEQHPDLARRAEFDRLHRLSVMLNGGVMVLNLAALLTTAIALTANG